MHTDSDDVQNAVIWLREHDFPWVEVKDKWRITHKHRYRDLTAKENMSLPIAQYYEQWKVLRLIHGYNLVITYL